MGWLGSFSFLVLVLLSTTQPRCQALSRGDEQLPADVHGMMPDRGWQELKIVFYSLPVSRQIPTGIRNP